MTDRKPLLRMESIDKHFPGVHALKNVEFDLYGGEVHILLGENGAGKSTLMKILSGSLTRDAGKIFINDIEVGNLDPERSQELGIGMVYQELSLFPNLSVAENIFVGKLPKNRLGMIDWRQLNQKSKESLQELNVNIHPSTTVRSLQVAEQQLTEIARVFNKQPKILLLDEPTSALSEAERERLFALIRLLQEKGVGIIYISHRLEEIKMIGTRVTVMRDGRVIGTLPVAEAHENVLIQMMVGRQLEEQFPKEKIEIGELVFQVKNLSMGDKLRDLSFDLYAGEILGVFGMMGAGQAEMARAVFGLESKVSGEIYVHRKKVDIRNPGDAIACGVGLLTRDRREGLVPGLCIPPNITLAERSQERIMNLLHPNNENRLATKYVNDLGINPPMITREVMYFSGGNQQKIVLARWLCSNSMILIFDEPTRGIDVGAKADVFQLMGRLAKKGVGIIMISSEMPEILAIADRILVIRQGKFVAELSPGTTQEELLRNASTF